HPPTSHEKVDWTSQIASWRQSEKGVPTPLKPLPDCIIRRDLFETRRRLTSSGHPSSQKMHCVVSIANSIEESKIEFCHWEKRSPLRQMKRAELVTPPRRVGSKGLFKLELWRDERR
ncbi:hypothetical protein AVEN_128553-1, partial [Araneus ventricosus]